MRKTLKKICVLLPLFLLFDWGKSLSSPESAWKQVTWDGTTGYLSWFPHPASYSLSIPADWNLIYGEGSAVIAAPRKSKATQIRLRYCGDKEFRASHYGEIIKTQHRIDVACWLDANQLLEKLLNDPSSQHPYGFKVVKVEKTTQRTAGGITFLRATLKYERNEQPLIAGIAKPNFCIMINDEGLLFQFDSTPTTERIINSLTRK